MKRLIACLALFVSAGLPAQAIRPGEWTGKLTVREVVAPGVPGFLLRMVRGKSRSTKRCVSPAQAATGADALLSPDPKAKCTVVSRRLADGRYEQVLSCPVKDGPPRRVEQEGRYGPDGLTGTVRTVGASSKGAFRLVADQVFTYTKATCR